MLKKINTFRMLMRYMRDSEAPTLTKILFFIPLIYFLMPFDILPDVFFPFGYLEDIGFLIFGWQAIKGELEKYFQTKSNRATKDGKRSKRQDGDNVVPLRKDDYKVD